MLLYTCISFFAGECNMYEYQTWKSVRVGLHVSSEMQRHVKCMLEYILRKNRSSKAQEESIHSDEKNSITVIQGESEVTVEWNICFRFKTRRLLLTHPVCRLMHVSLWLWVNFEERFNYRKINYIESLLYHEIRSKAEQHLPERFASERPAGFACEDLETLDMTRQEEKFMNKWRREQSLNDWSVTSRAFYRAGPWTHQWGAGGHAFPG